MQAFFFFLETSPVPAIFRRLPQLEGTDREEFAQAMCPCARRSKLEEPGLVVSDDAGGIQRVATIDKPR